MARYWREYLSEFLGTAILLFIGIHAVWFHFGEGTPMPEWVPDMKLRLILTGLLFAGGGTLVVYSPLGRRSGGHLNPVVTLSFWLLSKIKSGDAIFYMLAQFAGATFGTFLAFLISKEAVESINLAMTLPADGQALLFVYFCEILAAGALVALILIFTSIRPLAPLTGICVGLLVALEVFLIAPISGASMNPARSFGPAWINGNFQFYWIYLTAPVVGGILVSTCFKYLIYKPLCGKLFHPGHEVPCIFKCEY